MKHWPLRLKLALWSALIVTVAALLLGAGAAWHAYGEDVGLVDHVLKEQARYVYSELNRHGSALLAQDEQKMAAELPAAWAAQWIEIRHNGRLLYRSGKLDGESLAAGTPPAPAFSLTRADQTFRVLATARKGWDVRVAVPMKEPLDSALELGKGALLAVPVMLLVSGLGGWWLARRALAPVEAIAAGAERITAHRLDQRLPVPAGRDEVHHLTLVLNRMIERLEISLRQATRFSADASHELRTPLTILRAALEDALSGGHLAPAAQEQLLLDLLDETTQLSAISTKLLLLSRADVGRLTLDLETVDFAELVREAVEEAAIFAEETQIAIEASLPETAPLSADAPRLLQILRNLLENAVKYNQPRGKVRVELLPAEGALRLRVSNTGGGIAPEHVPLIFERFYRAGEHRRSAGHGLGLSISRELARAHGGELALIGSSTGWTVFELRLPSAPSPALAMGAESV